MYYFEMQKLPEVNMIGLAEWSGFWRKLPRTAPNNILVVMYKGESTFIVNDEESVLFPGDILFLPQGQTYQAKAEGGKPCRFYFIHFTLESPITQLPPHALQDRLSEVRHSIQNENFEDISMMPQTLFQGIILTNKVVMGDRRSEIFSLLEKALTERDNLSISSKFMITLYVSQIFALITKVSLNNLFGDFRIFIFNENIPAAVQEALLYIRHNYRSNITLEDLCSPLQISPQYLIRIFNKAMGVSPLQYINKLRIAYAKDLMRYTHLSLKEISYDIGLENPHYFSRLFKKLEGISPNEFKKSLGSSRFSP